MDYDEALEALKKGNIVFTTGGKQCFLFNNVIYADCDIGNMSGPVDELTVEFDEWGNSPYADRQAEDYYRTERYDKTEEADDVAG